MGAAEKRKGYQFEKDIADHLTAQFGYEVRRNGAVFGQADRGDLGGVPGWTLQLKNVTRIDLAGWVSDAQEQAKNAGTRWFAAIVKRRLKGASEAYVVMPLWVWAEVVKAASVTPEATIET